jgi:hypothetical protein
MALTNAVVAEPECLTSLMPKSAIGHDTEPVPSTPILTTDLIEIHLNVFLPFLSNRGKFKPNSPLKLNAVRGSVLVRILVYIPGVVLVGCIVIWTTVGVLSERLVTYNSFIRSETHLYI